MNNFYDLNQVELEEVEGGIGVGTTILLVKYGIPAAKIFTEAVIAGAICKAAGELLN